MLDGQRSTDPDGIVDVGVTEGAEDVAMDIANHAKDPDGIVDVGAMEGAARPTVATVLHSQH